MNLDPKPLWRIWPLTRRISAAPTLRAVPRAKEGGRRGRKDRRDREDGQQEGMDGVGWGWMGFRYSGIRWDGWWMVVPLLGWSVPLLGFVGVSLWLGCYVVGWQALGEGRGRYRGARGMQGGLRPAPHPPNRAGEPNLLGFKGLRRGLKRQRGHGKGVIGAG